MCVSKAAYPLQVFVLPYPLIFDILVFVVHLRIKNSLLDPGDYSPRVRERIIRGMSVLLTTWVNFSEPFPMANTGTGFAV